MIIEITHTYIYKVQHSCKDESGKPCACSGGNCWIFNGYGGSVNWQKHAQVVVCPNVLGKGQSEMSFVPLNQTK